jgi:hypothetical protein
VASWTGFSKVAVGDPVLLRDGVLRTADGTSGAAQTLAGSLVQVTYASPEIILNGPALIEKCENLVLDASHPGGPSRWSGRCWSCRIPSQASNTAASASCSAPASCCNCQAPPSRMGTTTASGSAAPTRRAPWPLKNTR